MLTGNGGREEVSGQVTQLLKAMRQGDAQAAETLLPLVYKELHRLASSYMRRERPEHTLQATALIHEAYLRLAHEDVDWKNREHFIGVAAHVMRRVLVDYARAHNAEMRGGGAQRVELVDGLAISLERIDEMLILDEALEASRVVERTTGEGRGVALFRGPLHRADRKSSWHRAKVGEAGLVSGEAMALP